MWIDDQVLSECEQDLCLKSWRPEAPVVVLGRSNKRQREVNWRRCEADGVPVLKRLGGGGTVILHPDSLIVSAGVWVRDYYKNDLYFRLLNQSVIDVIESVIKGASFGQRGYSDIVLGDKKCAGTSLFRSRNYLLYQASLLIDPRIDLMETYLEHPSLEPDYRKGRSHKDFVFGLQDLDPLATEGWLKHFQEKLAARIRERLGDEWLGAVETQIPHVKSRIGETFALD